MAKRTFNVKISGEGTKGEILSALWALARSIASNEKFEGGTFEDETLCSEITEN
jgi:hypothetical protein